MTRISLLSAIFSLLLCVGCGSGNGGSPPSSHPSGNFSQSSLKGQYTYQVTGWDLNSGNPFTEAGTFTSDGSGNLTAGTDDFTEGTFSTSSFTGSYTLVNDGTGTLTMNFGGGSGASYAVTLVSASQVYLIENDGFANAYGVAELQDTSALSTIPNGAFAFRIHNINISNINAVAPDATIGAFTSNSGSVSGNEDIWPGTGSSISMTGFFSAPGSGGRGTGAFIDSNGTRNFIYYIVNANNVRILLTDSGNVGIGRAEMQSGTFNTAAFSGGYVFGGRGDTSNFFAGIQEAGQVTADGAGNISSGNHDYALDGVNHLNGTLTGTYTMAANGRAAVSLTSSIAGTYQETLWFVSPTRAFFLVDDPSTVEDGTMDAQQTSSFSNATMSGQYAFVLDGFSTSNVLSDRVGTLQWDGNGGLKLSEYLVTSSGSSGTQSGSGTYTMSSNGRAVGVISGLSNNLIFYAASPNSAYVLQNDAGIEVGGMMGLQQ